MGGGSARDQLAGVKIDEEQFARIQGRNGLELFGLDD
jgi:hypothetical protein